MRLIAINDYTGTILSERRALVNIGGYVTQCIDRIVDGFVSLVYESDSIESLEVTRVSTHNDNLN